MIFLDGTISAQYQHRRFFVAKLVCLQYELDDQLDSPPPPSHWKPGKSHHPGFNPTEPKTSPNQALAPKRIKNR